MKTQKTLQSFILETLEEATTPLSVKQIADLVKAKGYQTNAIKVQKIVRNQCINLAEQNKIVFHREGLNVFYAKSINKQKIDIQSLVDINHLASKIGGLDKLKTHIKFLETIQNKSPMEMLKALC